MSNQDHPIINPPAGRDTGNALWAGVPGDDAPGQLLSVADADFANPGSSFINLNNTITVLQTVLSPPVGATPDGALVEATGAGVAQPGIQGIPANIPTVQGDERTVGWWMRAVGEPLEGAAILAEQDAGGGFAATIVGPKVPLPADVWVFVSHAGTFTNAASALLSPRLRFYQAGGADPLAGQQVEVCWGYIVAGLSITAPPVGFLPGALWDESFWKGRIGALGVEFKVEIALGVSGGEGGNFLYDDGTSLYDTATYSLNDFSWVELTARVLEFTATRGRDHYAQKFRAGQASILLNNQDGLFNPLLGFQTLGEQALRPGRWIKISGKRTDVSDDAWEPLWVGRLQALRDVYTDGAGGINSSWSCLGLEAWLSSIAPPELEVPDPLTGGQSTDERVRYIWDVIMGLPPELLITDEPGQFSMMATAFPGSRMDQINQAVDAEAGAFYVQRDGSLIFRSHDWLFDSPDSGTIQFIIGTVADDVEVLDARTNWDAVRIRNDVALTREGGVLQRNINTSSQAVYGIHSFSRSGLQNQDDAQIVELVNRELLMTAWDTLRLDSVEVWASQMAGSSVMDLLTLELGMRVLITVQTLEGWSYTVIAWVMGISHKVTADDWGVTLRLDNTDLTSPLTGGAYSSAYSDSFSVRED